ncbi:retinol dehydrogenase 12 isoform X1 [Bemisia tabaci]
MADNWQTLLSGLLWRGKIIMDDVFVWLTHYGREALSDALPGFLGGVCESDARLDDKVAVITGCSAGIGKITALEFCKRGARVIMACRDLEKAQKAADIIIKKAAQFGNPGQVIVRKLDLASFKSVRECANQILATEEKVHILVNNAGVYCPWKLTEDGQDILYQTNFLAHFLFTMLLLPRIISAAPARIINVSSLLYTWGDKETNTDMAPRKKSYSTFYAYARSKLAVILFTKKLSEKLRGLDVTTYAVHPGFVQTGIFREIDTTIHPIVQRILESSMSRLLFLKSPWQGAQTTLHCALAERAGKESGLYYSDCRPRKPVRKARDKQNAESLWNFSWNVVGLPEDYDPIHRSRSSD